LELCDLIAMQVHLTTMQKLPLLRTMSVLYMFVEDDEFNGFHNLLQGVCM